MMLGLALPGWDTSDPDPRILRSRTQALCTLEPWRNYYFALSTCTTAGILALNWPLKKGIFQSKSHPKKHSYGKKFAHHAISCFSNTKAINRQLT